MSSSRPRRLLAGVLATATVAGLVTGCSSFDRSLGAQELVVVFTANATAADADRVRHDCPSRPPIKQEPPARGHLASNLRYPLRYDVTGTTVAQQSQLISCLAKDKSVVSVEVSDQQ